MTSRRAGAFLRTMTVGVGLTLAATSVSAQAVDRPVRAWLGLGLGVGAVQGLDADGGVSGQLTAQWGPHHVAFRSLSMGDVGSFPDGSDDSIREVGILYGRRAAASFGYVSVAGGVARVSGKGFSGAAAESRATIGMPVTVEAGVQSAVVGLGIQLFGNLNSVAMYGGVAVFLQLGWMS